MTEVNMANELETMYAKWKRKVQPFFVIQEQPDAAYACGRAAAECTRHLIDHEVWFLAQIEGLDKRQIEKFKVGDLYNTKASHKAVLYQRKYFTQPEPALMYAECLTTINDIYAAGGLESSVITVLLDKKRDFPAWFRIVCPKEANEKIIKLYKENALMELIRDPRIEKFIVSTLKNGIERIK